MRRFGWVMMLVSAWRVLAGATAWADEADCLAPSPQLTSDLTGPAEWRLPLSPSRPDVLTEARLSVTLKAPVGPGLRWNAHIEASFPDPRPYGIPYSYEKIELQWLAQDSAGNAVLDWTQQCSQPGRALFPGQRWSQDWEIPGTEDLQDPSQLRLLFWGRRS